MVYSKHFISLLFLPLSCFAAAESADHNLSVGCCSFPISILIIGKTDAHYTMPIRLIIYGLFAFSELAFVAIAYWVVLDSGIVYSAVERSAV